MTSQYRIKFPSSLIDNTTMAAAKFASLHVKISGKEFELSAEIWCVDLFFFTCFTTMEKNTTRFLVEGAL